MPSRRHLLVAAPALALLPGRVRHRARRTARARHLGDRGRLGRPRGLPRHDHARARHDHDREGAHAGSRRSAGPTPTSSPRSAWCRSGAPKITWGGNAKGSTDWFDAAAAKLGVKDGDIARYDDSAGIPFDAIAATSPDLILGLSSGVSKEEYDKLSKIAPVVAYTTAPWGTPWQEQLDDDRHGARPVRRRRHAARRHHQGDRRRGRGQPAAQGQEAPRGPGSAPPTCRRSGSTPPPTCARRCCASSAWSTRRRSSSLSEATRARSR